MKKPVKNVQKRLTKKKTLWYSDSRADRNGLFKSAIFYGKPTKILRLGYLRDWKEEVKSYVRYYR